MPLNRSHLRWNHKALAIALVLALLLAQWSGFNHRVMHGGGQGSAEISAAAFADSAPAGESGNSAHHSCVAFDAAALGATIYCPPFVGPLLPNVHVLALWLAFASWSAPFSSHFLSRAPPVV